MRMSKKFIILATPRTGSGFLQTLLNSHSRIVVEGEIFRPGWQGQDRFEKQISEKMQGDVRIRLSEPVKFLEDVLFKHYDDRHDAVGFKLFYDQGINADGSRPLWNYLRNLSGLKVIHLKRKNDLRRYCSLQMAIQTEIFGVSWNMPLSGSTRSQTRDQRGFRPVNLNYEKCIEVFNSTKQQIGYCDNYFQDKNIIEVFYEELSRDYIGVMNRIQEFLGLPREVLRSSSIKQNTQSLPESILNYWELKGKFSGSEWIKYFEE